MLLGKEMRKTKTKIPARLITAICVFYRGAFQRRVRASNAEMIESSLFPIQSIGHSQVLVTVSTTDDIESLWIEISISLTLYFNFHVSAQEGLYLCSTIKRQRLA